MIIEHIHMCTSLLLLILASSLEGGKFILELTQRWA